SLSLPTRRPPSPPLFPYTTLFRSLSASRPVVGDRRAQREHGRPESRRDPTLVVGRRTDACPVRIETPSEGRDLRSIRKLRVHEQRSVRVCTGGGLLFRAAARVIHCRRCRQGGAAG